MPPPPHVPGRRTAHQREQRRIRIMAMVRAGYSYEAIARDECLTRERIRQIVTKSLAEAEGPGRIDHNRLQIARLEPALRLAARGIENGKLNAIMPLLKVLERLDKYGAVVQVVDDETKGMHERLMKKINDAAARMGLPYQGMPPDPAADKPAPEAVAADEPRRRKDLEEAKPGWLDL
jgi:hypothetical protein